jgi:hypothetical protein
MDKASTLPIARKPFAYVIFTPRPIVRELTPLLWAIKPTIVLRTRPTTAPSGAIIPIDLAC